MDILFKLERIDSLLLDLNFLLHSVLLFFVFLNLTQMAPSTSSSAAVIASLPPSNNVVDVSIIDTTGFVHGVPANLMMYPKVGKHEETSCPCYSFLIHHKPTDTRMLFDLGIRKDYETGYPPTLRDRLKDFGWKISVPSDVSEILTANGTPLDSINAIVWSHVHWDHTGDPSNFPHSTSIIVGPGFKKEFLPPYPDREDSVVDKRTIENREMIELDFDKAPAQRIGPYKAIDYFGDESFYFLDTPGHTVAHICALARTTGGEEDSTFIFMGGDIAHHAGEFRPSATLPLPEKIVPDPRQPAFHPTSAESFCPGSLFLPLHPASQSKEEDPHTQPFYKTTGATDEKLAQATLDQLPKYDGNTNVLTVVAHDATLMSICKFFPEKANDWKKQGWREQGLWRFLTDFTGSGSE